MKSKIEFQKIHFNSFYSYYYIMKYQKYLTTFFFLNYKMINFLIYILFLYIYLFSK